MAMQKLQPSIRFPHFTDDWKKETLGSLGKTVSGLTYSPKNVVDKGTLVLRSSNVKNRQIVLEDKVYVDTSRLKYNPVKKNDILICVRNGSKSLIGKNSFVTEECANEAFGAFMTVYRSKHNNFLFQNFDTDSYKRNVYRNLGARINSINKKELEKFQLFLPNAKEEKKIADFLEVVDNLISNLTKQKEKLEEYKKGVMQKIFSQEIRFKDKNGKDYPKWQTQRIKDIADINPKSNDLPNTFQYIDLESVEKGNLVKEKKITKNTAPSRARRLLRKKDILYQAVRPYQGNNLLFNKDQTSVASTGYIQIRYPDCPDYLYHYIHYSTFLKKVLQRCTGSNYPAIKSSDFQEIDIQLPSLSEQKKIALFLNHIDSISIKTTRELQALKKWKKGLLQKMFV